MRWLSRVGKKPLAERRLDAELQFHLEQQIADYVNSGMPPEEARRRASLEFGGIEQLKEDCRETRWENQLDVFRRDFSFALRGLRKDWRFAVVAIMALALSIGASTAMFSVVDNALFEPFAYQDAHRLVITKVVDLDRTDDYRGLFTIPEIQEIRKQNHVFESVAANLQDDIVNMDGENTLRLGGNYVTPGSLEVLSVPPFLGRSLEDADYRLGSPPVFVMRYSTWTVKFNSDASLIGKTFRLNGLQRTLVGVTGPRFAWGGVDLWMPTSYEAAEVLRSGQFDRFWGFIARLKPGVSQRQAQADMSVIIKRLAPQFPDDYPKHFDVEVESFAHSVVPRQFRSSLYVFSVAVGLLLLIGCGNVANLLLARATTREKEFAVRSALGASRSRIIRQLLVESFLLAIGGAALGIFFAWAGVRALATSMPEYTIASETVIVMNPAVLAFALALGVATIFIFGLVPAMQATRCDLQDSLRDSGKGLSGTSRGARLRNGVIIVEVALSLVLVFTAGLFIRSFLTLSRAELGIDIDHVFSARLPLSQTRYATGAQISAFDQALLPQLKSAQGVEYAAVYSDVPPFEGGDTEVEVEGKSLTGKANAIVEVASQEYFSVVRLPFLEGRAFSDADVAIKRKVAIINRTFQRRYFQYENPIGRRIHLPEAEKFHKDAIPDAWFEIVGVVADARNRGLREPLDAELWLPYPLIARAARILLVRTTGAPESITKTVAREVYEIDPTVAMAEPGPLTHYLEIFGLAQPRFGLRLVTVFALLGLSLVTIGVYSVIAYSTSRRTHEIGIRMALGAEGGDVVRMVMRSGLRLLLAGIGIGLAVSLMMARFLAAQLSGVSPYDVLTLAAVVALLLGVGLAASWIPARRATRVSPVTALRYE